MAKPTPSIVEAIDKTALNLLLKIDGDSSLTPDQATIFTEQVKAFGEIVKWAQTRATLLPKDDTPKDSKFVGIKSSFHAVSAKSGDRGSGGKAKAPSNTPIATSSDDSGDADSEDD